MEIDSPECRKAVETCLRCYRICIDMMASMCLEKGGEHAKPDHLRAMLTCAELCRATAAVLLLKSRHHAELCQECAEACDDCAESCAALDEMEDCVEVCRECAEACRAMSRLHEARAA
ncbi:MAG TPA: four-helix bundle copper-binding protein [Dongiaceae bacterium]|jgi:hypothetical protein|nr:four-helix bundle copper-binding protein [Dongiaceae bacterium]